MATARLSLDEVHDSIHTHDMHVENLGKSSQGKAILCDKYSYTFHRGFPIYSSVQTH